MMASPGGTSPTSASTCGSVTTQPWAMYVVRSVRSVANSVGDCPSWESGSVPRKRTRIGPPSSKHSETFTPILRGGDVKVKGVLAHERSRVRNIRHPDKLEGADFGPL